MARAATGPTTSGKSSPELSVSPNSYLFPHKIQVFGSGWGPCAVQFYLDGNQLLQPAIVLVGEAASIASWKASPR